MNRYIFLLMLCLVGFQPKQTVNIYMVGDSTMANKKPENEPERGWGQMLPEFFSADVKIHNHAQNGRSTKSFIGEGRWKVVLDSLKPGDYVIIQFGHNDQKLDSARHTDPYTSFKANLEKYVNETRAKGAFPVLCTSIVRRKFDEQGKLIDTHGEYISVTRLVAKEMNVPLLDLQKRTEELVTTYGPEKSKKLYVYTQPGEFPNRPEGAKDDTHLCVKGAMEIAGMAVSDMDSLKLPLMIYLKK